MKKWGCMKKRRILGIYFNENCDPLTTRILKYEVWLYICQGLLSPNSQPCHRRQVDIRNAQCTLKTLFAAGVAICAVL